MNVCVNECDCCIFFLLFRTLYFGLNKLAAAYKTLFHFTERQKLQDNEERCCDNSISEILLILHRDENIPVKVTITLKTEGHLNPVDSPKCHGDLECHFDQWLTP